MSFVPLILYLFCIIIRPQDWVPGFLGQPLISILAFITIGLIIIERLGRRSSGLTNVPQNMMMVGLYFAVIMSHVAHTYLGGAIEAFKAFAVTFILYFLILNGINSRFKFKVAVWFIVLMVSVLAIQGIYQMDYGYGLAGQDLLIDYKQDVSRINWIGIFSDPNDLALIFVVAAGIVLSFSFGKKEAFLRFISFGILGLLFYGIYLTNSRGGLLALMVTVYFFFVKRTGKFVLGGIVGGILAFVVLFFGPSRMGSISVAEASAFSRIELWYQGIVMLKSNPLFGVGYNMYMEELPQTAHNSYILAAAELGLFGYFCWIALIFSSFKGLSFVQQNDRELYNYALGLQSSLIGFCAAACFLSRTYIIVPYLLFALSGALVYIAQKDVKNIEFKFTKKDFRSTLLICIGSLFMFYGVVRFAL